MCYILGIKWSRKHSPYLATFYSLKCIQEAKKILQYNTNAIIVLNTVCYGKCSWEIEGSLVNSQKFHLGWNIWFLEFIHIKWRKQIPSWGTSGTEGKSDGRSESPGEKKVRVAFAKNMKRVKGLEQKYVVKRQVIESSVTDIKGTRLTKSKSNTEGCCSRDGAL